MPPYTIVEELLRKGITKIICMHCKEPIDQIQLENSKAFCRECEFMLFESARDTFLGTPLTREIAKKNSQIVERKIDFMIDRKNFLKPV